MTPIEQKRKELKEDANTNYDEYAKGELTGFEEGVEMKTQDVMDKINRFFEDKKHIGALKIPIYKIHEFELEELKQSLEEKK